MKFEKGIYKRFCEFHEIAKFADMKLYNGMGGGMSSAFFEKMKKIVFYFDRKFPEKTRIFSKKVSQK